MSDCICNADDPCLGAFPDTTECRACLDLNQHDPCPAGADA